MKGATPSALAETHALPRWWQTDVGVDPLRDGWVEFAVTNGFVARSLVTLTFDPARRAAMTCAQAMWWGRRLVRELNRAKGGDRYRRKWSHSYFGYVMGVEHHKSGAIHLHMVVDNWIDFGLLHALWQKWNGWAWIKQVDDDPAKALRYVVKYVVKEDERPSWWFVRRARVVIDGDVVPVITAASSADRAKQASGGRHGAHVWDPLSRP